MTDDWIESAADEIIMYQAQKHCDGLEIANAEIAAIIARCHQQACPEQDPDIERVARAEAEVAVVREALERIVKTHYSPPYIPEFVSAALAQTAPEKR